MDPTCASGSSTDVSAAYATAMAKRTQDQGRVDGQAALRLIQAALPSSEAGISTALPPDATVSVRA